MAYRGNIRRKLCWKQSRFNEVSNRDITRRDRIEYRHNLWRVWQCYFESIYPFCQYVVSLFIDHKGILSVFPIDLLAVSGPTAIGKRMDRPVSQLKTTMVSQ